MRNHGSDIPLSSLGLHLTAAGLLIAAIAAIFSFASTEKTMGDVQRIVYIHVPVAWFGIIALLGMAISGAFYLRIPRYVVGPMVAGVAPKSVGCVAR